MANGDLFGLIGQVRQSNVAQDMQQAENLNFDRATFETQVQQQEANLENTKLQMAEREANFLQKSMAYIANAATPADLKARQKQINKSIEKSGRSKDLMFSDALTQHMFSDEAVQRRVATLMKKYDMIKNRAKKQGLWSPELSNAFVEGYTQLMQSAEASPADIADEIVGMETDLAQIEATLKNLSQRSHAPQRMSPMDVERYRRVMKELHEETPQNLLKKNNAEIVGLNNDLKIIMSETADILDKSKGVQGTALLGTINQAFKRIIKQYEAKISDSDFKAVRGGTTLMTLAEDLSKFIDSKPSEMELKNLTKLVHNIHKAHHEVYDNVHGRLREDYNSQVNFAKQLEKPDANFLKRDFNKWLDGKDMRNNIEYKMQYKTVDDFVNQRHLAPPSKKREAPDSKLIYKGSVHYNEMMKHLKNYKAQNMPRNEMQIIIEDLFKQVPKTKDENKQLPKIEDILNEFYPDEGRSPQGVRESFSRTLTTDPLISGAVDAGSALLDRLAELERKVEEESKKKR